MSYNFLRVYNQQWDCSKAEPGRIRKYKRPIVSNEIETVVKNLPTHKSPAPDDFPGKFCQTLIEELTLILLKLFQNIAKGEALPNSFFKPTFTLIVKAKISQKNIPSPGNLPKPGITPESLVLQANSLHSLWTEPPGETYKKKKERKKIIDQYH